MKERKRALNTQIVWAKEKKTQMGNGGSSLRQHQAQTRPQIKDLS